MGITTWACPKCGQAQRAEHPNGEAFALRLCAACEEQERAAEAKPEAKGRARA
jgi:hypothetical protein